MDEKLRELLYKYISAHHWLAAMPKHYFSKLLGGYAKQLGLEVPGQVGNVDAVLSELWKMTMEGVLQPKWSDDANPSRIIGFTLTEYGKTFLEGPPIDRPNQYIADLREQVPAIADEVITYIRESLTAYNHGCYFAATVMLGVAAERLFEILLETYIGSMPDQSARTQFSDKITDRGISKQYEEFMKKLPDLTGSEGIIGEDRPTTNRLRRDFGHAMKITFETIRSHRNYAAHPRTNGVVSRDIILMNLTGFQMFCQRLYNAIEWLKNKTTGENE